MVCRIDVVRFFGIFLPENRNTVLFSGKWFRGSGIAEGAIGLCPVIIGNLKEDIVIAQVASGGLLFDGERVWHLFAERLGRLSARDRCCVTLLNSVCFSLLSECSSWFFLKTLLRIVVFGMIFECKWVKMFYFLARRADEHNDGLLIQVQESEHG